MFLTIYAFMAIATAITCMTAHKPRNSTEVCAAFTVGLIWPLFLTVKFLQRIV